MQETEDPDKAQDGAERRRHSRFPIRRAVQTRGNSKEHHGKSRNISASGVAVEPTAWMNAGDAVEVDIEDLGVFQGTVTRIPDNEDFFAIAFESDDLDEDELVSELTRIHDDIAIEEF